jgi:hypothetical protein
MGPCPRHALTAHIEARAHQSRNRLDGLEHRPEWRIAQFPEQDPIESRDLHRPEADWPITMIGLDLTHPTTSGMTSVDFDNRFGREPNALVATKLDFDGFWNLMLDAIGRIG